jgi:tocopherol O-methyltransferase
MQPRSNKIIEYYNTCESDYRMFWDLDHSMAMHAGFWDHQTASLSQALARENEVLAEFAEIQVNEKVLDAGCGIGGSSLFLAKNYGCQVMGITLSEHQVEVAKANAKNHGVDGLVNFETMDFCHTTFPDASFDVIWGIESVCHAEKKLSFVQEAYRLLKEGGRLIVADGFATKSMYSQQQFFEMSQWLNNWGVESLDTQKVFEHHLTSSGFFDVVYRNATANIMPSSKRLYHLSFPIVIISKVGEWLGIRKKIQTNNIWAAFYQYTTLQKELWEYGIFCARKSSR